MEKASEHHAPLALVYGLGLSGVGALGLYSHGPDDSAMRTATIWL